MSPRDRLRFLQATCAQMRSLLENPNASDRLREERGRLLTELSHEVAALQADLYPRPQQKVA